MFHQLFQHHQIGFIVGEGGDGNVVCPNGVGVNREVELGVANGVAYLNVE